MKIRKCGGCTIPLNQSPLVSPDDLIFMKKERRPKRGKKWTSADENDFTLANVHFHASTSCTGPFESIVFDLEDVQITEVEREYLHGKKFYI